MQVENLWSGIIAFILGATLIIAFYAPIMSIINVNEPEVRIFVAVIAIIALLIITVGIPIGALANDDRGRIS